MNLEQSIIFSPLNIKLIWLFIKELAFILAHKSFFLSSCSLQFVL